MLETNLSNRFLFLLSLILCYGSNVGHALAFQTTRKVVSDGSNIPVADAAAPAADENLQSRKHFLRNGMVLLSASTGLIPKVAEAAVPVTIKETDSLGAMAKRALQPKPPKVLRRKLAQDFAVLLMRSSYNALDQLDCVAMVRFQSLLH